MLPNLSENFFYALCPPVILAVDSNLLIQAVIGGFQDHVGDLRYFASNVSNFYDPQAGAPRTILVSFQTDAGEEITIPLEDDGTAPADGPALLTWAAGELEIDVSLVQAAVTGSSALRTLGVDQVELLAQSLGATLYPGQPNELPADTQTRREQIVATYFPRLKIKGTTRSFGSLARLCGYDNGELIPLWSRVSPRSPDLAVVSLNDFAATPNFYPTASLPDPFYNPQNTRDGPWYFWQSGSLYPDPNSPSFYTSVNGQNPFISVYQDGTSTGIVPTGTYTLAGGSPQVYATAPFTSGAYSSNLVAEALVPGESPNGVKIIVSNSDGGSWRIFNVEDRLSSIKYRSSYFDATVNIAADSAGTELVQPSPDLKNGLVTSDGTATAPWRPWTGGLAPTTSVSLWPNKVVTSTGTSTVARTQASVTSTQIDTSSLDAGARRVLALAQDDVIAATRRPRHFGAGLVTEDTTAFAPYVSAYLLASSMGSYYGSVSPQFRPPGPTLMDFYFGGSAAPSETVGSQIWVESPFATGSYDTIANTYRVFLTTPGSLTAVYTKLDTTQVNPEPTLAQKLSGQVTYQDVPSGSYIPGPTVQTGDELPWHKLRLLAGGDDLSATWQLFNGDPPLLWTGAEMDWLTISGQPKYLRVIDTTGASPYPVKAIDNPTPGPINPALGYPMASPTQAVPMSLVRNLPLASSAVGPQRLNQLSWWWSLTESNQSDLLVTEMLSGVRSNLSGARWFERVYDPAYGWKLSTIAGVASSTELVLNSSYSFGVRMWPSSRANAAPSGYQYPLSVGQVYLRMASAGSAVVAGIQTAPGSAYETGPVPTTVSGPNYVYASYQNGQLTCLVRENGSGVFTGSSVGAPSPLTTTPYVTIGPADPVTALQDVCVWSGTKTTIDLVSIDTPPLVATASATSLPYSYSLRGDKFSFEILAQGFGQPGTAQPNAANSFEDSTIVRYGGDGGFYGDLEFKRVGLGENQPLPGVWQLGYQAAQPLLASGAAVLAGSQPAFPGFTSSFIASGSTLQNALNYVYYQGPPYGSNGGSVYSTYTGGSWFSDLNSAVDHVYLYGNDGSVYSCYLDNFGYGPVFVGNVVTRDRQTAFNGIITRDEPTDHVAAYASGSNILVGGVTVTTEGDTVVGFLLTEFGDYILAEDGSFLQIESAFGYDYPFYLYMNSQTVAAVTNPFTRWANPNAYGTGLGVAALESAGEISFAMTEFAGGPAPLQINMLVGNIGQLDPDFTGFNVQVSVEGAGVEPVVVPTVLLSGSTGYNPQAWQTVNVPIPTSLIGNWIIKIKWTNDRTVTSRGWTRSLGIYQLRVRTTSPTKLYQVSVSPFTITEVSLDAPASSGSLQAGAWIAHVTNAGSVYPYKHEALALSTPIDNPFGYPLRPAADTITGSSARRFNDLRTVSCYLKQNQPAIAPPVINGVTYSPVLPLYNVGQAITFNANVSANYPRYVWQFWNSGTTATASPTISSQFISGGTQQATLTVVDSIGQTGSWSGSFVVNYPPVIAAAGAFPNDQYAPFTTTLQAYVSDADNNPVSVFWRQPGGALIATGTTVPNFSVTQSGSIYCTAQDNLGGTSTVEVWLAAETAAPPVAAIADYTQETKFTPGNIIPQTLQFAAIGGDQQNRTVTPVWSFWDGLTTPGISTPLTNFGTGSLFKVTRTIAGSNVGYYPFSFTLTDPVGLTTTVNAGVQFDVNGIPTITRASSTEPAITAGTPLYLSAAAVDPEGDTLSYVWTLQPGNITLYGPDVTMSTDNLPLGATVQPTIQVSDAFGGVATQSLPGLPVNAIGLGVVTIDPPSGQITGGVNVQITASSYDPTNGGVFVPGPTSTSIADQYIAPGGSAISIPPPILSAYVFDTSSPPTIEFAPGSTPLASQYKLRAKFTSPTVNIQAANGWNNNGAVLDTLPPPGNYTVGLYWLQYDPGGANILVQGPQTTAQVIVTSPTVVRYTVNGAAPVSATDGLPYSGPFQLVGAVGSTSIVQARAFQTNASPSPLATSTYDFIAGQSTS